MGPKHVLPSIHNGQQCIYVIVGNDEISGRDVRGNSLMNEGSLHAEKV